jgi:hypothetical protein
MNPIPNALADNYHEICSIEANLQDIPIPCQFGPKGPYYEVIVDVVLLFGCTELKAQIAWTEDVREIFACSLYR